MTFFCKNSKIDLKSFLGAGNTTIHIYNYLFYFYFFLKNINISITFYKKTHYNPLIAIFLACDAATSP